MTTPSDEVRAPYPGALYPDLQIVSHHYQWEKAMNVAISYARNSQGYLKGRVRAFRHPRLGHVWSAELYERRSYEAYRAR